LDFFLLMMRFPPRSTIFSLHDALPIFAEYLGLLLFGATFLAIGLLISSLTKSQVTAAFVTVGVLLMMLLLDWLSNIGSSWFAERSEEHTSELQSQSNLVCRLLLVKKNT